MAAIGKDYFGWGRVLSVILAIIGKIVAAILRLILGWNIIWLIDLVLMIVNGRIMRLLNI